MSADSITEDKLSQKMILNIVKIQRLGKGLKKNQKFCGTARNKSSFEKLITN